MDPIYWNTEASELAPTTNVSYNCVDRYMSDPEFKHETALLWDGNFWDNDIHDYADLSWDVVDVLINKIANVFKEYCVSEDRILLLLHNVIQLPLCIMGASRIGAVSVILNPATATTSQLTELLEKTCPKLIVTVDAFWQGHELLETKRQVDEAFSKVKVSSIKRILVIRHTAPNKGVPPPDEIYPGKRPCYKISFELNEDIDVEWRKEIVKAYTSCDPVWVAGSHPFAILPKWSPELHLQTVSTRQALMAARELGSLTISDCLVLPHPQTPLGLIGCVAVWFCGKTLSTFEGTLNHPDPSRLKHVIKKFDLKSMILPKCELDADYMAMVPVPTLSRIITTVGNKNAIVGMFPNVEILEWNVEDFWQHSN
ncbi:hypothetical protein V3C99_001777 [Haemonchus contortus]